jgi:hypothetical protein
VAIAAVDTDVAYVVGMAEGNRLLSGMALARIKGRAERKSGARHAKRKRQNSGQEKKPRKPVHARPEELRHAYPSSPTQSSNPQERHTARSVPASPRVFAIGGNVPRLLPGTLDVAACFPGFSAPAEGANERSQL